ncbi:hypothetical protein N7533_001819 [Penicillium manginii]|uniref:uncharacterized protein n=1 Tax=Penicillium manginii TaxID=203109 RepID=UPI0025497585|nr:uncharacterized protein N7533_001819 [Penicillium manginii]KAJ5763138.1 hypothetical protein N7533_001819 [Penicillium manginii]
MDTENTCSACSWSPTRQEACCYKSHVKLFYGVSNRGAWSLGSNLILKERSIEPPNFESANLRFLSEKTSILIPQTVEEWKEDDGTYFLLTKRIQGHPLNEVWSTLCGADKERIAKQTAEYLIQLRTLHSSRMESLNGQPLYNAFLFINDYGIGHGPLSSGDELWAEMSLALTNVPEQVRSKLRQHQGNLAGILDWESSGYFPVWWEFTAAGIGLGQEDKEWKDLLRKYLPDHTEARNFWLDFFALRNNPKLDERGLRVLNDLGFSFPNQV